MMTRSIWTLALFLLVLHTCAFAAELTVRDLHVRSVELDLLEDLQKGAQASPTLKSLLERLETSDVVVYLMFDHAMPAHTAGRVSLMTAVPGRRYLRISIDRRSVGCQRLAILGHELQHAVEIADAAEAIDQAGVAALYRRIGFRSESGMRASFDSQVAIETGQRVRREVLSAPVAIASR
jgi:hypothetical protein